jgi:hypothetical protein
METLTRELTETAKEEIERAAAEAAKAAALAALDAQAQAIAEARKWQELYRESQKDGIKNMLLTGALCLIGGFTLGAGTMIYGGMR